ncbi:conserved hypothetical protein [Desulfamplus magnetovallimortis]|uniref:PhoU domain-containing protein n=1 Tax=Desulfamplus magnetovallimortis TaxID=1246637 RepID=L0R433_9BACT|nr:phosphate uptake regulator PhoU [Desulfamplus magnetovallimortis]CCO06803.1 conserved hypothetical protein [Desulfamplus magnetovallimortis BW-1]SLM32854.1 conserved hypothetical protein [Desulfamplus magnetovallimortis]
MRNILANFKFLAIETENQIKLTRGLLSDFNLEVLEKIGAKDDYIDNLKTTVENACFSTIATLKPAGNQDAITRIRAIHIMCINLERIADFCVNITRQTRFLSSSECIQKYDYKTMFNVIQRSISTIMKVFDANDLNGALQICKAEFELDRLWEDSFKIILEDLKKGQSVTDLITIIFIFRYLERIGDSILNIGEALIFAIMGDRIKIRQFEALEKTLSESGFEGTLNDIDFASIWGSRSGCRVSKVSRKKPSGFKAQGIFKEGKTEKIKKEHQNICRWETIHPGLAPRVFGYYEKYDTASMLVEFLSGCTLDQILLTEEPENINNVLFIFEQTVMDIWEKTLKPVEIQTDYMAQLNKRLNAIKRVYPEFCRTVKKNTGSADIRSKYTTQSLIISCQQIEKSIPAPFSVFIHGDFNTNNIVYNHEEEKINYIDLHRSKDADYVQDASVFLVSNFRMPVFEAEFRERLSRTTLYFLNVFRTFAKDNNDTTFEARMALALARSFFTSTRFELQYEFAGQMCQRAHMLMEKVLNHKDKWENFTLPDSILIY